MKARRLGRGAAARASKRRGIEGGMASAELLSIRHNVLLCHIAIEKSDSPVVESPQVCNFFDSSDCDSPTAEFIDKVFGRCSLIGTSVILDLRGP